MPLLFLALLFQTTTPSTIGATCSRFERPLAHTFLWQDTNGKLCASANETKDANGSYTGTWSVTLNATQYSTGSRANTITWTEAQPR